MTYKWDNKKPTAQMLGRWQTFSRRSLRSIRGNIKKNWPSVYSD
tara:strand:+ start:8797 stop:8928 length:132 start_codon:yes stop_codon:yes gene_type:complete